MSRHLTRRSTCRLCGNNRCELVVPMKASPIGDAYVTDKQRGDAQELFPLDLYLCRGCGHLQLLDVVDPALLFGEYTFATASSAGLVEHFRKYAAEAVGRFKPAPGALVVEIGSNDGSLLRFFKDHGLAVLGIDPAREMVRRACNAGIDSLADYFTSALARKIRADRGPASLMAANNVFAHVDDLRDVVKGVKELLAPDGVFIFEASYLVDTIEKLLFDTVYHEHLSYHSIAPLVSFFAGVGLELFDVVRIPSKGGSIRGFVQHQGGPHARADSVGELLALEKRMGLAEPDIFRKFSATLEERKRELHAVLGGARGEGKRIAGFGASVTVTTLLYHFELGGYLDFLADDNREKSGLYSPGLHLPVLHSDALYERRPDMVVILAWQYADPIMKKHARFAEQGGRFVVPLPAVKILHKPDA